MRIRLLVFLLWLLQTFASVAQKPVPTFNIPIFAYHRFGDGRYPSTNISLETFEQQLQYLKENKYTVFTFGEAVAKWENQESFPDKSLILTVDDGYLSFYTGGFPLLKKYGFKATVFVQTGTVGGGDFMSWQQIKEIQDAGIEIGNHSDSHAYFVDFPEHERKNAFQSDFETASSAFIEHLGTAPKIYAYPYGEWTKDMEDVLQKKAVLAAAVQKSGVFCESSDPLAIPRFPMGGPFATINGFKNKLQMKALRVAEVMPATPFLNENPPRLTLKLVPGKINVDQLQFFVDGQKSESIHVRFENDIPIIELIFTKKLTDRRTLYTITAPSMDGKTWHWYSHLWISPEVKEE
jgi:peptidoglycan/xylan/chitin deacetylase (PgdA/CDA1 family)